MTKASSFLKKVETIARQQQADELNAAEQVQTINTTVLVAAACGRLDLNALAIDELAARGFDPNTGTWVGFDKAKALAVAAKSGRSA